MVDDTDVKRLLLVDDEVWYLDVLAKRLTHRGFAVTTASSGAEAIRALRSWEFDVAVVDLKMEDMDGIEVLKVLKKMDPALAGDHPHRSRLGEGGARRHCSRRLRLSDQTYRSRSFDRENRSSPELWLRLRTGGTTTMKFAVDPSNMIRHFVFEGGTEMSFFKAWGEFMMVANPRPRGLGALANKLDSARPQTVAVPGAAGGPDLRLRPGCGGSGDGSSRSSRRCAARCAGRQEGLQPGLLSAPGSLSPRSSSGSVPADHRLHRRRWRLHHRARP